MTHLVSSLPALLPLSSVRWTSIRRDAGAETLQRGFHVSLNVMGEFFAAIDMAVGADFDLHRSSVILLLAGG